MTGTSLTLRVFYFSMISHHTKSKKTHLLNLNCAGVQ